MRPSIHLLISLLFLIVTSVAFAATGRPIELIPQNMSEMGFSIECRFRDQTIKEGNKPTRPTGVIDIQVIFDADKGPLIKSMDSAVLVITLDKQAMWIPLQWANGQHPGYIQFSIPESMVVNTSIVLTEIRDNSSSYAVILQKFRQ